MSYLFLAVLAMFSFSGYSETYRNPITTNFGCADPALLKMNNISFFMACTGGRFPVRKSDDMLDWRWMNRFAVSPGPVLPWAKTGRSWAPELAYIDGRYVSYFTQNSSGSKGAIGVSWTSDIYLRDFKPARSTPLLRNDSAGGVIDPSHFFDPQSRRHYILFKVDGNSINRDTSIKIRQLTEKGNAVTGNTYTLKTGGRTMDTLVEGQDLIYKNGYYYLFYSHGSYVNSYRVKVARSKNLFGPYTGDRVILAGNRTFRAPGHGKVVSMPGKDLYFYHAYDNRINDNKRYAMIDEVHWKDGWPLINNGSPSSDSQYVPKSPQSFFHKVTLRWTAAPLRNPHYSVDIKTADGQVHAPCINAGIIRNRRSVDFDGSCPSKKGFRSVRPQSRIWARVCAAQDGIWSGANRKIRCTKYQNMYNRVTWLKF